MLFRDLRKFEAWWTSSTWARWFSQQKSFFLKLSIVKLIWCHRCSHLLKILIRFILLLSIRLSFMVCFCRFQLKSLLPFRYSDKNKSVSRFSILFAFVLVDNELFLLRFRHQRVSLRLISHLPSQEGVCIEAPPHSSSPRNQILLLPLFFLLILPAQRLIVKLILKRAPLTG